MPEISSEHLVEVVVGAGNPPAMRVRPGEPFGPISVGTGAAWQIKAPGVTPQHAELYFNGSQLYVRSSSAAVAVLVDGRPVLNAWTSIDPPCELSFGHARLRFGADPWEAQRLAARAEMLEDEQTVPTDIATRSARVQGGGPEVAPRAAGPAAGPKPSPGVKPKAGARPNAGMMIVDEPTVAERSARGGRGVDPQVEPPEPDTAPLLPPPGRAEAVRPTWGYGSARSSPEPGGPGRTGAPKRAISSSQLTRIEPLDLERLASKRKSALPEPLNAGTADVGGGTASLPPSGPYPQAAGAARDRPSWSAPGMPGRSYLPANYDAPRTPAAPAAQPRPRTNPPPPASQPFGAPPISSHPAFGAPPPSNHPAFGAPPPSNHPAFGAPPPSVAPGSIAPPSQPASGTPPGVGYKQVTTLQSGAPAPAPGWNPALGTMPTPQLPTGFTEQQASNGGVNRPAPRVAPAPQGMSLPKKLTAVLFLPMVVSVAYLFMGDQIDPYLKRLRPATSSSSRVKWAAPSASARTQQRAAASSTATNAGASRSVTGAAAAASASVAASAGAAASVAPPARIGAVPGSAASAEPATPGAALVVGRADLAGDPPAANGRAPAGKQPTIGDASEETNADEKQKVAGGRSLQREAADAVAAGAYARAAKLYEDLARKHPGKPAYAEAAAILRAKAPLP